MTGEILQPVANCRLTPGRPRRRSVGQCPDMSCFGRFFGTSRFFLFPELPIISDFARSPAQNRSLLASDVRPVRNPATAHFGQDSFGNNPFGHGEET